MSPIPRAGHMCRPACDARKAAMLRAEFLYHWTLRGWVFSDPAQPMKQNGEPFTRDTCPWCGGDLPDPVDGVIKALEEDTPDAA